MQYILDASFFFAENRLEGDLWTTAEVADEIRDHVSKMRFEVLSAEGLKIGGAGPAETAAVKSAAEKSGDLRVLSDTDISVIAFALASGGTVVSGDFAVQNVCRHLKIPVKSLLSKTAKKMVWKPICSGCGAEIPAGEADCPICGAPPKKRGTEKAAAKPKRQKY